mmetsp:Transcript_6303/g.8847  ORF Transcript_6303/g.8847 Transcript_6303/m.8847 type:complete len:105 (-) Transcript_6303:16-330(-)
MILCKYCLKMYQAEMNHDRACRYHPGLFVCRFHPNSAKASADGLGYYGDGEKNDGWPARFWDCCGSEDETVSGCSYRRHMSYDDNDSADAGLYMLRIKNDGSYH